MSHPENDDRFAQLLRAHHIQLFGYLYAIVHNISDAEDLYQETSLVLWDKFSEYREGTNFFAWAMATARYHVANFLRTQKRRWQFTAGLHARLRSSFEELDAGLLEDRLEALQECKKLLAEADCCLLDGCYGSNLSLRETAGQLGRTPKSVYRALDRIRSVLMRCVKEKLAQHDGGDDV
jgi:RNA polymerase sigma-70 factor, ECF subfamily